MNHALAQIEAILAQLQDPFFNQPLTQVAKISLDDQQLSIELPYPAAQYGQGLQQIVTSQLQAAGLSLKARVSWKVQAAPIFSQIPAMSGIKNIIAVASGKGGVGKSTTAVNLALALAHEGARVGVLDADIYGPSQGLLLGLAENTKPEVEGQLMRPVVAHGVQCMSMAFLVNDRTPMVWRGPMVSGALQQLLTQTAWQDLDYLIVDMPPGTGDIQLTLSQRVPVSGAVIVTTPQDLALLDAIKGIEMFRKVKVPVLGVVENMAMHQCSACGHVEHIFGQGGGDKLAADYQVPLLASLPLSMCIRQQADQGRPALIADPEGLEAAYYLQLAKKTAASLVLQNQQQAPLPSIEISDD